MKFDSMSKSLLLFFLFTFFSSLLNAQEAFVHGIVKNESGEKLQFVNIGIEGTDIGVSTDIDGTYLLKVPANRNLLIQYRFIGFEPQNRSIRLKANERLKVDIVLKVSATELNTVEVKEKRTERSDINRIDAKLVASTPSVTGSIESLIQTLPGVSSNNELSTQYSVRGGSFDENLVYVNGIEIHRPLLIRSGQQEGLSFINPDLVSNVAFSAGGFEAKYGDKMSSVLDITYKQPEEFEAGIQLSLLGVNSYMADRSNNKKFSYLLGIRYKSNRLLLNSLDTRGDYNPTFADVQAQISYAFDPKWELSFLGNFAQNNYTLTPSDRTTTFGSINEAFQLKIYYDGHERDRFKTVFGSLSLKHKPKDNLDLSFTTSAFQTTERESFDIQAQYWIGRLETNPNAFNLNVPIEPLGVGTYLTHARNSLQANVVSFDFKGNYYTPDQTTRWGAKVQIEDIKDRISEWRMVDSAYYSLPHPDFQPGADHQPNPELLLNDVLRSQSHTETYRASGYVQHQWHHLADKRISLNAGLRISYWSANKEFIVSPRANISYKPQADGDLIFRFASGLYYQPPFYKELRNIDGSMNLNIKSQRSIHFVLSSDWIFQAWNRPFKLSSAFYYKKLDNLIPYKIDNVRIRYLNDQIANGYAYGIDLKVNGEFVEGVESWVSLSLLKTNEDIEGDQAGHIPRPTDQRFNLTIFFQDYLPNNPSYKVHLKLVYGSGLPFGPPNSERAADVFRIPSYRRADIGFSKEILGSELSSKRKIFRNIKSLWLGIEVLNLFQIDNTISYLWVTDVNQRSYATPNFLTGRQLNFKLIAKF